MNQETMHWKLAWDTFHLQIFDYEDDVKKIEDWIKKRNFNVRNILDIGCGACHHLKSLRRLGYDCTGVDFDKDILEYARQLVLREETDIKLIEGDILKEILPGLERKFDLVIAKHLSFPIDGLKKVLAYTKQSLSLEGPRLLIFDFLLRDEGDLDENIFSIDKEVKDTLFLVRLNQMRLREKFNEYHWKETYIIRDAQNNFTTTKTNQRSLWFISQNDLEKLLRDKGVKVEHELGETIGIKNLKGVTLYGRFS